MMKVWRTWLVDERSSGKSRGLGKRESLGVAATERESCASRPAIEASMLTSLMIMESHYRNMTKSGLSQFHIKPTHVPGTQHPPTRRDESRH